jgi:hypothetical protein
MPISLEEDRPVGLPVVKRTAIGQTFVGLVVKAESRDRMKRGDDGTMRPMLKPDGKARQEMVVTAITAEGTTSPAGLGDDVGVPEPGALVRLILKGKAFGDWIEAKRNLGRGIQVGDVVTQVTTTAQRYDADGQPKGDELTTQEALDAVPRGQSVGVYGPLTVAANPDSAAVAEAEKVYHSLSERIAAEPAAGPFDEEPF